MPAVRTAPATAGTQFCSICSAEVVVGCTWLFTKTRHGLAGLCGNCTTKLIPPQHVRNTDEQIMLRQAAITSCRAFQ